MEWKAATNFEYQFLIENVLNSGMEAIGCKLVFKVKYQSEEEVECYKGHLVAEVYFQRNLCLHLSFNAIQNDMIIHQENVS